MVTDLSCQCGKVHLVVSQEPIMVAECYCNSCREAVRRMEALPGAPKVVGAYGSSHYVMYRKDRVQISQGKEWLRNFRLGPKSPTRRVIASCCNTPVLTELKGGHWASLYGNLWHGQALPKADLRTQTTNAPDGSILDDAVPAGGWETTKFYGRLLAAWAAMGFKSPVLALDTPEVELRG
ncbi:hypothetical protein SAMN05428969_1609 [Devosia sp. YR412]|uniref:GFA family protein n=1 Tax=Devosia sp. YR412 TaxID=1881030 RepID=UPI0008B314DA|nr:DUF6151 family protein [Devosia sp. YR412]SEQ02846.1 hypothetical protein SAMN05428969_1609 [Devosia sp. YR412]